MSIATLMAWLLTAGIGGYMLRTWLARGGLRHQRATGIGVPPPVVFGHAGVALTGLVGWLGYLATGWAALAWLDVGLLGTAITFGICMVTMWTPYPVRVPHPDYEPAPATATFPTPPDPGEHGFTITDEMIAELLTSSGRSPSPRTPLGNPFPGQRWPKVHLLPLIPVCHGFAALATFMLATVTAALGR